MLQSDRSMDVDALRRLVIRLLAVAERCNDVPCRLELMRLADEFVAVIEGSKSEKGPPTV
jgi:hypothetical protein